MVIGLAAELFERGFGGRAGLSCIGGNLCRREIDEEVLHLRKRQPMSFSFKPLPGPGVVL